MTSTGQTASAGAIKLENNRLQWLHTKCGRQPGSCTLRLNGAVRNCAAVQESGVPANWLDHQTGVLVPKRMMGLATRCLCVSCCEVNSRAIERDVDSACLLSCLMTCSISPCHELPPLKLRKGREVREGRVAGIVFLRACGKVGVATLRSPLVQKGKGKGGGVRELSVEVRSKCKSAQEVIWCRGGR